MNLTSKANQNLPKESSNRKILSRIPKKFKKQLSIALLSVLSLHRLTLILIRLVKKLTLISLSNKELYRRPWSLMIYSTSKVLRLMNSVDSWASRITTIIFVIAKTGRMFQLVTVMRLLRTNLMRWKSVKDRT